MFRARILIWLVVGLGGNLLGISPAKAQANRLFAAKVPQQSEALRSAPRRTPPPPRPDTVSLPYNLIWGDTQNRLASLFAGVGAKITDKKTEAKNEVWTVQGLIAPNLQSSMFTFQDGRLAALEFDYGQAEWDLAKYNEVMGQFRRLLEAKCEKPGEMISRDADQPTADGLKQSLMGYQWSRGDTLVQLFYFSAEDPVKSLAYRSISVHYHYQDPTPPAPADDTALPVNPNADPNVSPLFGGRAKLEPAATPAPSVAATPAGTPSPGANPGAGPDTATSTPNPSPGDSPTGSPAGSPAGSPDAGPTVTPTPTPSPAPTPKNGKKGRKSKPTPTPEVDSLPLPEH